MMLPLDKLYFCFMMALSIKGNGRMIGLMGWAFISIIRVEFMKGNFPKERKMDKGN